MVGENQRGTAIPRKSCLDGLFRRQLASTPDVGKKDVVEKQKRYANQYGVRFRKQFNEEQSLQMLINIVAESRVVKEKCAAELAKASVWKKRSIREKMKQVDEDKCMSQASRDCFMSGQAGTAWDARRQQTGKVCEKGEGSAPSAPPPYGEGQRFYEGVYPLLTGGNLVVAGGMLEFEEGVTGGAGVQGMEQMQEAMARMTVGWTDQKRALSPSNPFALRQPSEVKGGDGWRHREACWQSSKNRQHRRMK